MNETHKRSHNVAHLLSGRELASKGARFREKYCKSHRSIQTLGYWKDLKGHKGCVNSINFSHGGDLLVSGSDDTTVKIWNINTGKCLDTLYGHVSNVFASHFLPYCSNKEIVSGSNDSDIRHFDIEKRVCTTYRHHSKKVLGITINPLMPETFLSCSADGTIHMTDLRVHYVGTTTSEIQEDLDDNEAARVLPQAFGGGRRNSTKAPVEDGLLLNYTGVVYNVDFHPNGYNFIASCAKGDVRLFDLRKLENKDPDKSYVNIYRNYEDSPGMYEMTGCAISKDGTGIVGTALNDNIYEFDTSENFEKKCGYVYLPKQQARPRGNQQQQQRDPRELARDQILGFLGQQRPELLAALDLESLFMLDEDEDEEEEEEEEEEGEGRDEHNEHDDEGDEAEVGGGDEDVELDVDQHKDDEDKNDSGELPNMAVEEFGHFSSNTIKGVSFYGPNSEYVMSGSDDACIYIWDRKTAKLLRVLQGHKNIVNCVVGHPSQPMIASSGIDKVVKLWENVLDYPTEDEMEERQQEIARKIEENSSLGGRHEAFHLEDVCVQQ